MKLFSIFNKKKFICYLLLSGIVVKAFTQNSETALLMQQFDKYRRNALPEKIFVHTDKDFYLAGEIMWFKIYAVDGFFHKPLDLNKVAYVELLDFNNKPVLQAKIKLEKAIGNGSLFVPVNFNSGNYKLRAYTNWMKNFGAEYFFEKQVKIINAQNVPELPLATVKPSFDIHFYPEGGNLVNGLQSKVAFSVKDKKGKGIDCKGMIINNRKDTIARFQTLKFGLGNFNLTPQANQVYTALVTMPGGTKLTRELPPASNNGYTLNLDATDPKAIKLIVRYGGEALQQDAGIVYLLAHTRGSVKAAVAAALQNGTAVFSIDKEKFGDGISHLTVFNSNKKPVCERLFFKHPSQALSLHIKPDAASYDVRKRITIDIVSNDEGSRPIETEMSMAVYRVDSLQSPQAAGINEYLWLGSDLTGNIESPEYYLRDKSASTAEAMDNLVLVNGWRRFRWEDVLQSKTPFFRYTPEMNGHVVKGKIVNAKTGLPGSKINSFLSAPGINTMFRTSVSDDSGNVRFEMKNYFASPSIIVQTTSETGDTYHVQVENPFSLQYTQQPLPPFEMPVNNPVTLLDHSIGVQAENIYRGDKRNQLVYGLIDTIAFYYKRNELYMLDNYTRFTTMEEVLREYVMSVNVRRRNGGFFLPMYNDADVLSPIFTKNPLILLDGVPVFDIEKIMRYDPLKIRKLESVTRRYFYGDMAFDGIVNLFTYDGSMAGYELDPNATVIDYEALQLEREFYSPVYETPQEVNNHLPDFRNVLNWSPMIRSDAGGTFRTSFYSSDLPGKYVVVVNGLNKSGKAGTGMGYFEVKKPAK